MATNRISVLIDVMADGANRSLKSFKQSITDADGATNKFKAGASASLNFVKTNAAEFAAAAGAALVAFGVKSVDAFQTTALEAGKLRDSLGVTAEEASRLMEVAEDLGIGTETLERSIGIMNRTATNTPAAFEAIGAELKRNADGTTNVNETFLSTIEALKRIPDASARAAAAQKVFGRSWMEMAELIELGADGVRNALDSVEGGKIIDDGEVERARRYRDALDALKGVSEELTIEVGGRLVPALTEAAEALIEFKNVAADLGNLIPGPVKKGFELLGDQVQRSLFWPKYFLDAKDALTETTETTGTLGQSVYDLAEEVDNAAGSLNIMTDAEIAAGREAKVAADEIKGIQDAFRDLRGELSDREAILNIANGFDDVKAAGIEAWEAVSANAADAEQKARDYELAQIDLTNRVIDYAEEVGNIPPSQVSEIQALIDQGLLDEAERKLAHLARYRPVPFDPIVRQTAGFRGSEPRFHSGGIVGSGNFANDEVPAVLQKGEMVLTEGQQEAVSNAIGRGGGGNTTNVYMTINASDPNAVIAAIRKWERTNGPYR